MTDIDISSEAVERLANRCIKYNDLTMAATLRVISAAMATLQQSQPYRYIGKDGKPILARDLEDQRDAAVAALDQSRAETAAAYERAASRVDDMRRDPQYAGEGCDPIIDTIRALTAPDQSSALEAIEASAEARGMRKVADIVGLYEKAWDDCTINGSAISEIVRSIIAAIPPGEIK